VKGLCPFKIFSSPSPLKERGIQGVRLINNLQGYLFITSFVILYTGTVGNVG